MSASRPAPERHDLTKLLLAGDVMTGRGIDQILQRPGDPTLYEHGLRSAVGYVHLAERKTGPIPRSVPPEYIWGDALETIATEAPDALIINLETAVTDRGTPWPGKGIHYRMNPDNVDCLTVAGVDGVSIANNHVLDWSHPGLDDTISTLRDAGVKLAGAGRDAGEAFSPVVLTGPDPRVVLVAVGTTSSGIPDAWAATGKRSGVALVDECSTGADQVRAALAEATVPGDVVVASIHWGGNWGHRIPQHRRRLAKALLDAGVHVVHGHSSHHAMAIEVHEGRPILYGSGDFINDYEGIGGREEFRGDLRVAYLLTLDRSSRQLEVLHMAVFRSRRFRLQQAGHEDTDWLATVLANEGRPFGTSVETVAPGRLAVRW